MWKFYAVLFLCLEYEKINTTEQKNKDVIFGHLLLVNFAKYSLFLLFERAESWLTSA